jgi:hypothetical protein
MNFLDLDYDSLSWTFWDAIQAFVPVSFSLCLA